MFRVPLGPEIHVCGLPSSQHKLYIQHVCWVELRILKSWKIDELLIFH
jgi:hypothetical protein